MSTPAEIFRPNEIVHVIDESVSRWTKAKIIGIVRDWSVKKSGWATLRFILQKL